MHWTLWIYFITVLVVSLFGLHRIALMVLYFRHSRRAMPLPDPVADTDCPHVVVQLPIYNERFVVESLLESVAALDWPADRLHIQLLDDSDDDTVQLAAQVVDRLRSRGVDTEHLRRLDRGGFKSGALAAGLRHDDSPFVAIFDADFRPQPDFLRRAVAPLLADERLGMVQGRWQHNNADHSLLCQLQAVLLNGHFVMEHGARFRSGRFFNFNGTAGVWRRAAIVEAGGWSGDTLCEDLDLSYRAQLAGWRFAYLQDLGVPSELPVDVRAFKSQQHRWAKGSIQVGRKLLGRIWRAPLPPRVKLEATAHLTNNVAYLGMAALLTILPVAVAHRVGTELWMSFALDLPIFLLATASLLTFYGLAERELDSGWWRRLHLLPFVLALGAALTINNTRAVGEAAVGHASPFVRTPKGGARGAAAYRSVAGIWPWFEILAALYYAAGAAWVAAQGMWLSAPFMALLAWGFGVLGWGSLRAQPVAVEGGVLLAPSAASPEA